MWRGARKWWVYGVVITLLVISCNEPGSPSADVTSPGASLSPDNCEIEGGAPLVDGESVELEALGEDDGVRVHGALYPHPDYEGNPWSQWGQGIVVSDGRFFSAIGDHIGRDGNSYVYEYDPDTRRLKMVGDILSYVDHVPGTWGFGKIHSQMVEGSCGEVYFSTYWGTSSGIEFEGEYTGDLLFMLNPAEDRMGPLEVPVEFHGQASLAGHAASGLLYGEAVDPLMKQEGVDRGPFFVYDLGANETVFTGPDEPHVGFRSILVDADGAAYYSVGGGVLEKYDPVAGESSEHASRLPGDRLRAVTAPGPDGSVYGVTQDPERFFSMSREGEFDDLGAAVSYTTSLALSPDGSTMYYLPGAHGGSAERGSPLIAVDTTSGEQTTIIELNEMVERSTGYTIGGSYNIAMSDDGNTIFLGVNVAEVGSSSTFGEVMLLVIELR